MGSPVSPGGQRSSLPTRHGSVGCWGYYTADGPAGPDEEMFNCGDHHTRGYGSRRRAVLPSIAVVWICLPGRGTRLMSMTRLPALVINADLLLGRSAGLPNIGD